MNSYIETSDMNHSGIARVSFDRNAIDVSPEYQRNGDVWTLEKKQYLIDSILNNFDLPKLYFHNIANISSGKNRKRYAVIDGRQRLEAIWGFIDGSFPLSRDFKYFKDPSIDAAGMNYVELAENHPNLKLIFDTYNLPITIVETDDIDLIDDMFLRLNEAVPLNAAEKRNAIRGPMVTSINNLAKHEFFTKKVRIGNRRFQHKEVSVRLLFLIHCLKSNGRIIDTKKAYLDNFVREFKKKGKNSAKSILNETTTILDSMTTAFTDGDVLLNSQSAIPIYFLLFRDALNRKKTIGRKKLIEFRKAVSDNKRLAEENIADANFELLEFDRLSQQGTNDAVSIRERTSILKEFLGI